MSKNLTEIKNNNKLRSERMIEWILENKTRIDTYDNGNIQFSFIDRTLKVKDENYERL